MSLKKTNNDTTVGIIHQCSEKKYNLSLKAKYEMFRRLMRIVSAEYTVCVLERVILIFKKAIRLYFIFVGSLNLAIKSVQFFLDFFVCL